jgi:hypothetical protein
MAAMSNYLETALINHIFRTSSFTQPAVIAVALCTAAPDDTSTGATITEVANSNDYSRVSVGRGDSVWAATSGTDGTTSNSAAITFTAASGSWGTVTHVAIVDSASWGAGNVLFYGQLSVPKTITSGDVFQFNINQLSVQIDN